MVVKYINGFSPRQKRVGSGFRTVSSVFEPLLRVLLILYEAVSILLFWEHIDGS
jgi:hypothetical protein